jgi:hypothetical protein
LLCEATLTTEQLQAAIAAAKREKRQPKIGFARLEKPCADTEENVENDARWRKEIKQH